MENKLVSKVFLWMFIGLLITFVTGYVVSGNENMLYNIFTSGIQVFIYLIEIVIVVVLTARINKMQPLTAKVLFCLYSFMTGLTFAVLFAYFSVNSIIYVFVLTAGIFGIFAYVGSKTKMDLSKISTILFMGLLGVILVSIFNMFIKSTGLDMVLSILCVCLFMGITAYDMQKIKRLQEAMQDDDRVAIIGAFELYLDFINIFIELLRLFGKSRK
ncbi:MAG TPA: Bax inhibitor-1/YccA family protein [Bacilli bacterium]|nr:Bax inhibitor-1/YccA family protein [Bacilli bacterium]